MSPTSDYLTLLTSIPQLTPISLLSYFLLGLMRMAPIVAIAPFFGSKLPAPVKMGIALSLTVILLPQIIFTAKGPLAFNVVYVGMVFKELLLGMLLAFLASIPFYIAQSAGILVDFLRGSSALMVQDPVMQTQASPIGLLYNYVLIVIFFQIGGPFYFLEGVVDSYKIIPADGLIHPLFFSAKFPLWNSLMQLLTQFTSISIQLAAPSLVAILMAEMFLGIANRLAPQVQIAFLGMAIKSLVGIALLCAGWYVILQQMAKQSTLWLQQISNLLRYLHF